MDIVENLNATFVTWNMLIHQVEEGMKKEHINQGKLHKYSICSLEYKK